MQIILNEWRMKQSSNLREHDIFFFDKERREGMHYR